MNWIEITSPPPRRILPSVMCPLMALGLAALLVNDALRPSPTSVEGWFGGLAMLLLLLYAIWRNLFLSESLSLAREEIVSVTAAAPPLYVARSANLYGWGFEGQRLIIETTCGRINFGLGLNDRETADIIHRLEVFCGRPLIRPDAAPYV
ncbi:hypothetical protein [Massilia rubra]|uniref:PH domain-containing protein n=1 Tax=Massilia rubra TaxID=2607910 RepID=A0ABX0LQP0_9BURK|nr:hypothetical protein [Massilia rubra]NHZ37181.1 hypothetical protein [Massilia rubra]